MRDNSIHLGALSFVNDKEDNTILSSYKNVVYGRGVKFDSKHYEEADSMHRYDLLNMHKMKRNYIAITANMKDCVWNCDDVTAIPASYRQSSIDKGNKRVRKRSKQAGGQGSGIVLLFLCVFPPSNKTKLNGINWNDEAAAKLKFAKNNVLMSSKGKHFDSTGEYYSFGNKGNFGMVNNSSIGIYCSKLYRNIENQKKAKVIAEEMEKLSATEVGYGVMKLSAIIPNIHKLLSPVVDVAFNMQAEHGDVNLQQVETSASGLWQSKVCINASTKKWHTENDCSYTLVSVPEQDCTRKYVFFIKLNANKYIGIPMASGVSFVSSMKFLTHRQQCIADFKGRYGDNVSVVDGPGWQGRLEARAKESLVQEDNNDVVDHAINYINVCSYANSRLFSHIRASMQRNIANNKIAVNSGK